MCRVCRGNYYYAAGRCLQCPDLAARVGARGVPIVFGVATVGALLLTMLRHPKHLPRQLASVSVVLCSGWRRLKALGLIPKCARFHPNRRSSL